jgi:hypothetical protein
MPDDASYDPGTRARAARASGPDERVATGSFKDQLYGAWNLSTAAEN